MGLPNPRPDKVTIASSGANKLILYVKPADVAPYVGSLSADAGGTMVPVTQAVGGHTRRRYIGGPNIGVAAHNRNRTKGDYENGHTLPGNNAWFEKPSLVAGKKDVEQITYVGSFRALKAWAKTVAELDFTLRSPWGEPFLIEAIGP